MDPSIMKLLEEDEDESMHSGADVEAFTAALNRDIEGAGALCSHPSDSSALSQGDNQKSAQMYSQWQPSNKDENKSNQCQQPELMNQEQREQKSSEMEVKEHVSSVEVKREANSSQAPSVYSMQYSPLQVDSRESQLSNLQRFGNQPVPGPGPVPVPVPEQVKNSANRAKQIPFGSLLPIILPELDKERAVQLQTLYAKLRRNEIPKDGFVRLMRNIVGDQMLRLAVVKMQAKGNKNPETIASQFQAQSQNLMQQQQLRPPTGNTAAQFSDPYSFGQLHQKSQNTFGMTFPPRTSAPAVQPQKDPIHKIGDNSAFKPREAEHLTDSHGLTKQQLQHLHFPQSSFPTNVGVSGYNPYPSTNVSTSSTMVRPQLHDPQIRQVQLHQGFGSTYADGTSQGTNAPQVEQPNSFTGPRVLGSTVPNISSASSMPHNSVTWQPMVGKEQNIGVLPSMGYLKQEPVDHTHEKQQKPANFTSQGPSFLGALQSDPGKGGTGTPTDEVSDRQHHGVSFPSSTRISTGAPSNAVASHLTPSSDTDFQPQTTSASPMSGNGANSKASAKKPSGFQKRPLDSHTSSPPLSSKKQKVSSTLPDQSIEQLNDVTAVSGVNLREEEEQLFSGSKDDSRVSEASRRAVQEEEDRLILQKNPLQKKLVEIITKCGLKNLSNNVERCLSLCVEERLRALISSLIRVSKQRVDSEKSRHNTVVTSDVREQILAINKKAMEDWEIKQAEAEKLRINNDPNSSTGIDGEKEKDEGRGKLVKQANKEDDDKMRTTAANVAARAAVGGDDMLSKWQLMAQAARQKRDGGPETASILQTGKDANYKPLATSTGNAKDIRAAGKRDHPTGVSTFGGPRQFGRGQVCTPPSPTTTCNISVKDVIAVLEREPQMAKSTAIYRLYDMYANASTE